MKSLALGIIYLFTNLVCAQPSTTNISIQVSAITNGNNIIYKYKVINNSSLIIHMVSLGTDTPGQQLPSASWVTSNTVETEPQKVNSNRCKAFTHMFCQIVVFKFEGMTEQRSIFTMSNSDLALETPPSNYSQANWIMPGTSSSIAELTVPSKFSSTDYLRASGEVYFLGPYPAGTSSPITSLVIPFTQVDTIAPKLSLKPIVKISGESATITIDAVATDNIDPNPDVRFISIKSNDTIAPGEVPESNGPRTRAFIVKLPPKRKYHIKYNAIDASGNVSSATVVVPKY